MKMKKAILAFGLFMGVTFMASAQLGTKLQSAVKTATTVASASGFDVNSLKSSILSSLTTKLALSAAQKTKVGSYITTFLTDKSKILSLATTDKASYASKLTGLTSKLTSNLKTTLTASQYTKFLGLKPATNSTSNVLSQLFY